jgi:hypothetical protein
MNEPDVSGYRNFMTSNTWLAVSMTKRINVIGIMEVSLGLKRSSNK